MLVPLPKELVELPEMELEDELVAVGVFVRVDFFGGTQISVLKFWPEHPVPPK